MTGTEITEQEAREILEEVKHPAIDMSLIRLGIIKEIEVQDNDVKVIMAFPFPNVPIKDMLVDSVKRPLEERGISFEIETTVMDREELRDFLALEKEGWKGFEPG